MATAPAETAWTVQLRTKPSTAVLPAAGQDELARMLELMMRAEDVRAAALVPLREDGLAVAVILRAPNAAAALDRARRLTAVCARGAGLGEVTVSSMQVAPEVDVRPPEG